MINNNIRVSSQLKAQALRILISFPKWLTDAHQGLLQELSWAGALMLWDPLSLAAAHVEQNDLLPEV